MNSKIKNSGEINLAGYIIPCYVTEDGTRLLSGSKMQEALKISTGQRAGTRIAQFVSQKALSPYTSTYISEELLEPISCYMGDKKVLCYHAETLVSICGTLLKVKDEVKLTKHQEEVCKQCVILMEAFANVGLISLIDEATGYQKEREDGELQKILSAYISEEVAKWQLTFSSDFYRELYRLYNIPETTGSSKPWRVGLLTAQLIYRQLPNGVFPAIKEKTGKSEGGYWNYQLHRNLTEGVGRQDLKRIINEVTAFMAISENKEQFKQLYNRRFNRNIIREAV